MHLTNFNTHDYKMKTFGKLGIEEKSSTLWWMTAIKPTTNITFRGENIEHHI